MTLVLDEEAVRRLLTPELAFEAARLAFAQLGSGQAVSPPRSRIQAGGATLNTLSATSAALGVTGTKSYAVVRTDVTRGAGFGLLLFDTGTGALTAVLEADTLGNLRTAAATAVATCALARPGSATLTVVGTGWVAQAQVRALLSAMPSLTEVLVVGRRRERAERFCDGLADVPGVIARTVPDAAEAVGSADVVVTATGSSTPVLRGAWLRAGTHVNAVGSNYATKRELDDDAIRAADRIVVDTLATARLECGDLLLAESGWPADVTALGDVVVGRSPARQDEQEITLFESQGIGILDVVTAHLVVSRALAEG
ncbi:MAG TPA: ornithine cyclodeaminase family protein [Cellulomonas sp.]